MTSFNFNYIEATLKDIYTVLDKSYGKNEKYILTEQEFTLPFENKQLKGGSFFKSNNNAIHFQQICW